MRPPTNNEEDGDMTVQKISSNSEQIKHADKELKYQYHCSFLEIYNEQITDLLDPNQRNLQIQEGVKTGVYVENLTEECVSTMVYEGCEASFITGSTDVGKILMVGSAATVEKVSLELGGNAPCIIFDDADLDIDARGIEQIKHADKELKYQCRCSFLEIYNEQITDLLDPNQRNLQFKMPCAIQYSYLILDIHIYYSCWWMLIQRLQEQLQRDGQQTRMFSEAVDYYAQLGLQTLCLEIIGVAAIEDKLQDGVSKTIETLRKAGISL
nr:kinesin-like protein KIN-12B [Ipomoea batatas]